jgi:hypothetical protein
MGHRARGWLSTLPGYSAIAVRGDGSTWHTAGFAPEATLMC